MRYIRKIVLSVREEEQKSDLTPENVIERSRYMTGCLLENLNTLKEYVLNKGFDETKDEIEFFKKVKPEVQGKLIFYNKVFRIETSCPTGIWQVRKKYFSEELQKIEKLYKNCCNGCLFCRYYNAGRCDMDEVLFTRGQFSLDDGLCSHIFDSDHRFSTYYDYKAARIIADELFYNYLLSRIDNNLSACRILSLDDMQLEWTDTKNALIELIYALNAKTSISGGKAGIRKIAQAFQAVFNIDLGDIHHAFHRMKDRTGARTPYLDQLKKELEDYMDKNR